MKDRFKKILKLFKQRSFIFVITVYPLLLLAASLIERKAVFWATEYTVYYSSVCFLACILITFLVLLEVAVKVYNYELQGDKLKIREQQGINIEEVNNDR